MMMFQRSSKKNLPFPSRPEQPTVAEIVQDINGSSDDDIVLTYLQNENQGLKTPDSNFSDSTFSFGDQSKLSISSPQQGQQGSPPERNSVDRDSIYQKAVEFLNQTEKLQNAPEKLDSVCTTLEELSRELTDSIDALKEQAQTLVSQSASTPKH